ncbi:serine hydrolase [Bradyrhizobium sp. Tv2a-2]|uniref:serine hydrolase domain-containing protein n=1 Tax=Bradyrhizobium sp. Tv2a-2 TaxID=113395 RepID=UPI001FD94163|nr:serine hydrolase [Bradyrhizobium sp. Tv2a-2]
MDSANLAKLVAFGSTRSFDSLLIARHGKLVLDAYYAPYTADIPHAINSSTKAVIGTLIAIAHSEGLLDSLDHPLLDFFPGRDIANVDDNKRAITVQHLLNMTSGFEWEEGAEGGREQSLIDLSRARDWTQFILDRPMAHQPGMVFYYNSGNPDLLSAIITKLTGKPAADYAQEKLFGPLGIEPPFWRRDPQGLTIGACCLFLSPHDMAKIGYLYLRRGEWAGQQILPPEWIDAVSHATINMHIKADPSLHYSDLFWAIPDKHVYMTVGLHCQLIMMFPDADIVAVVTARNFCGFSKVAVMISGAVESETALPANPEGAAQLAKAIADVATEQPSKVGATPPLAAEISGKTYRFPDNSLGVRSLTLSLLDIEPHYRIYARDPTGSTIGIDGPIGLDGLYRKSTRSSLGVRAVKGWWADDQTFAIDVQYVGMGEQRRWLLRFDGLKVTVTGKGDDGSDVAIEGTRSG